MTASGRAAAWAAILIVSWIGSARTADAPADLRKQLATIEGQFHSLYNRLNTERQYDMICRMERAVGTLFARRVCNPRFVEEARVVDSSEQAQTLVHAGSSAYGTPTPGGPAIDAARLEAFRVNVQVVTQAHPELLALAEKRDALRARLDDLARARSAR